MSISIAALAGIYFLLGSVLKGILGIGLPMVAIPLLTLAVGLPQALALTAIPVAVANLLQVIQFRRSAIDRVIVVRFLFAGALGVVTGVLALASISERWLERGLALVLILYILWRVASPQNLLRNEAARHLAAPLGLVAGLLHGTTGISAPIAITFFHAQGLQRPGFVLSTGITFLGFTVIQIPMLGMVGLMGGGAIGTSLVGLPAIFLGLWLGNRLARHVNRILFDRMVLLTLGWAALTLLWRSAGGQ